MSDSENYSRRCVHCGAVVSRRLRSSGCVRCMLSTAARPKPPTESRLVNSMFDVDALDAPRQFGPYRLDTAVGHGGMGVVYRAQHVELGRKVALKLLLMGRHASPDTLARFRREARSVASLQHPHIVAIYDIGESEGQPYIAMEYVEGRNLAVELARGLPEVRSAVEQLTAVSRAVQYAHGQGVIHRDIKPSNLLVDRQGGWHLTDFGLAKRLDGSGDITDTGRVLGTPNYLAPECTTGTSDTLTEACDIYALGAVLYELLTGRPPFLATTLPETLLRIRDGVPVPPRDLVPGVPRDLETICLKCLEKDPARRYATAGLLAEDLERWLQDRPILARRAGVAEQLWKWTARQPRLAAMTAIVLLAIVMVLVTLGVANRQLLNARERVEQSSEERRKGLVRLNVQAGNTRVDANDPLSSLVWYVEALRLEGGIHTNEDVHRRRLGAVFRQSPRLEQVWFHDVFVTDVSISPPGDMVAAIGLDNRALYWETEAGVPWPGPSRARWGRFWPDGRHFVFQNEHGDVRVWRRGDAAPDPNWPRWPSTQFAEDASGQTLAFAVESGVQMYDFRTGNQFTNSWKANTPLAHLSFSADGRYLGGCSEGTRLVVWDLRNAGSPPHVVDVGGVVNKWLFDPSGERLAVVLGGDRHERVVRQFELRSGTQVGGDLLHASQVYSVDYSPDGSRLATAEWMRAAHLWDPRTSQRVGAPLLHEGGVRIVLFSPDGSVLVTASWDTTVRFFDPRTARPVSALIRHGGFATAMHFSADGTLLVTGSQDTSVRVWRMPSNQVARLEFRHDDEVARLRFDLAGKRLVTSGRDGAARLWDRETGRELLRLRHESPLVDAKFSEDGAGVLTGSEDKRVRLWNASDGKLLLQLQLGGRILRGIDFSPDGKRILTFSDSSVRVWDASSGVALGPVLDGETNLSNASFSPDGNSVAVATGNGDIVKLGMRNEAMTRLRVQLPGRASVLRWSPDGKTLLTAWTDSSQLPSEARLWDSVTGESIGPPMRQFDGILVAEFSRNGEYIATGGEDNSARIWRAATGQPLTPPLKHSAYVLSVAFSPDGRFLATGSEDGVTRVWEVATGEAVTPPLRQDGRAGFVDWSPDGREIVTAETLQAGRIFDVSPDTGTVEQLKAMAELMGVQRLHPTAGVTPLTADEMRSRWGFLRAQRNLR